MLIYFLYILFFRKGVGNAFVQCCLIRLGVKDDRVGFLSVPSGTSCFLEVGFYGIGQIHVDDNPYIRFVDTHTECIGGDHDTAFSCLPALLADVFGGVIQSGMVEIGGDVFVVQQFGNFLGTATVAHIDDGASGHTAQDVQQLSRLVFRFTDDIGEIFALETHAEHIFLTEMQTGLDIFHYFRSGSGCQCQHGYTG